MGRSRDRTRGEAAKLLSEYENLNSDLPRRTRRHLGLFILGPKVGTNALEELTGKAVGNTIFRHRSWMWWNIFRTAGLRRKWDDFVERRNDGEPRDDLLREMRESISEDHWKVFSRRAGVPVVHGRENLHPSDYPEEEGDRQDIWTKGGTWRKSSPFTQIILLGKGIGYRPPLTPWQRRLGQRGVRKIERELHGFIDPDETLHPDAHYRAIDYVRRRIVEILGYDFQRASCHTAAWFFQKQVPNREDWFFKPDPDTPPTRTDNHGRHSWRWFPDEQED